MFQTVGKLFCINGLDFFKVFLIAELRNKKLTFAMFL